MPGPRTRLGPGGRTPAGRRTRDRRSDGGARSARGRSGCQDLEHVWAQAVEHQQDVERAIVEVTAELEALAGAPDARSSNTSGPRRSNTSRTSNARSSK